MYICIIDKIKQEPHTDDHIYTTTSHSHGPINDRQFSMRVLIDGLAGGGGVDKSQAAALLGAGGGVAAAGRRSASVVDAHTGLVLAALLCGLVGALSLHTLLRCVLHYCGGRRHRHGAAAPPDSGLKKSAIRRIPVVVYEAEAAGAPAAECAICLGEFADGETVRLLPRCRHGFHVRCIDVWLSAHSSCPICRDSLLEVGATAAGEATVAGEGT